MTMRSLRLAMLSIVVLTALACGVLFSRHNAAHGQLTKDGRAPNTAVTQKAALAKLADEILARYDRASDLRRKLALYQATTAQAEVAVKAAEVALDTSKEEFKAGFAIERQKVQGEIALARSELARAEDRKQWAARMLARGHITRAEQMASNLDAERAAFAVDTATSTLGVLEHFQKPKQAQGIDAAERDLATKRASLALEQAEQEQLAQDLEREALSPGEVEALGWLREAIDLHEKKKYDEAQARLDEATKLWQQESAAHSQRQFTQTKRRLDDAARELSEASK